MGILGKPSEGIFCIQHGIEADFFCSSIILYPCPVTSVGMIESPFGNTHIKKYLSAAFTVIRHGLPLENLLLRPNPPS